MRSRRIVFISGAGLPAWLWDEVRSHLGQEVLTAVAARPGSGAALDDYAGAALEVADDGQLLLVGHSAGAVVALRAAQLAPHRVDGLLAVAGAIPSPGGSFISTMPALNRAAMRVAIRIAGTRPPDKALRRAFAELRPDQLERLLDTYEDDSVDLFSGEISADMPRCPTGYVHTTADREIPAKIQAKSRDQLHKPWTDSLATGHLPMLTAPNELASSIARFAEHVERCSQSHSDR